MIPGHTKFKCDGSFGLIKKLYRKTTVDCVSHIVEVVEKSSSAGLNKPQCYENKNNTTVSSGYKNHVCPTMVFQGKCSHNQWHI